MQWNKENPFLFRVTLLVSLAFRVTRQSDVAVDDVVRIFFHLSFSFA
jgi:hypothetical protein